MPGTQTINGTVKIEDSNDNIISAENPLQINGYVNIRNSDETDIDSSNPLAINGIVNIEGSDGNLVDVQHPVPCDGDSVYAKDIWVSESDMGDFTGSVTDLVDNLHTISTNSTSDNPKEIFIHFNRTVPATVIGVGCYGGGNFSNLKLIAVLSGEVEFTLLDESSNNTKRTTRTAYFAGSGFNALKIQFHTTDSVCISNLFILKAKSTVSRIQGQKPDDTFTEFQATQGGNFKVSIEELENGVSVNENSQLKITTFDSSGNEIGSKQNTAFTDNIDSQYGLITASAMYGRATDDYLVPVKIDASTQDMQTIEHEHAEIHSGDHYNYCDYQLGNAVSDTIEIIITTPNTTKWAHLLLVLYSSQGATLEIYEGTTGVSGGTSITPRNNNRNSANTSTITLVKDPTSITGDGTRAAGYLAGAGKEAGINIREKEKVLKQNTTYLARITSLANSNDIAWCAEWYEHTNKI